MQRQMDSIQFESRNEIEKIMIALSVFMKDHPNDASVEDATELYEHLDIMHMEW